EAINHAVLDGVELTYDWQPKFGDGGAAFFRQVHAILTEIVEQTPENTHAWFLRGVAAQSIGWREEALLDLTEAIQLDPDHARAYLYRSEVLASLGKYDMARKDRAKALAIDPKVVQ